jgi:hypothetical protein
MTSIYEADMPEKIRTVELVPWSLAELVGEEDFHPGDDEPFDPGLPERRVSVLIDGFHVRKNLAVDGASIATGDAIVAWLDDLVRWLLDRFLIDDVCVSYAITAWDADATSADIDRLERATGNEARLTRLRAGMSDRIRNARPEIAHADWHFVDLRVGTDHDGQVAVDPHIERDLLLSYLADPHSILLVARDEDYVKVVEAVAQHADERRIEIISLHPADRGGKGLKAYEPIAADRWTWTKGEPRPTRLI